ncbi:MAG: hypothetical protein HKP58_17555 [Desulfatitalea sp.]|nr:hypothetical protein [Desulfatitalea sp.]NNK02221.1 hypothetical protein [Desulfatitalea sp.]
MPKVARQGRIVEMDPIQLSEPFKGAMNNPDVAKLLTTTDENGIPHCVCKHSMLIVEDDGAYHGCIAYLELIEMSQSYKNMIWTFNLNKTVAITTYNPVDLTSYQVKGVPYLYLMEGPLWQQMLKNVWEVLPMAEPAGAWLIVPTEERDENFSTRMKAEDERFYPPHREWLQFRDASYARRYGTK